MIPPDDLALIDPDRLAACAADEIAAAARRWNRKNRRPAALSAREALIVLKYEALIVAVAALNLANGMELTEEDRERLLLAHRRVDFITEEVA